MTLSSGLLLSRCSLHLMTFDKIYIKFVICKEGVHKIIKNLDMLEAGNVFPMLEESRTRDNSGAGSNDSYTYCLFKFRTHTPSPYPSFNLYTCTPLPLHLPIPPPHSTLYTYSLPNTPSCIFYTYTPHLTLKHLPLP